MIEEAKRSFAKAVVERLTEWLKEVDAIFWEAYCEAEMPFGPTREGMWHWVKEMTKT